MPVARSLRVLLVEDNVVNQRVACGVLERQGHAVVIAANGREALAAVEAANFDLVLMDVQMPEMDGLAATAAIRQREQGTGRHLPIVALTANNLQSDRERCRAVGMDGFVAKPFQVQLLLHEMDRAVAVA